MYTTDLVHTHGEPTRVPASSDESFGCAGAVQARLAVRGVLEVVLGWTSGAIVIDVDMISKIGARCPMRNEHGYNSLFGRSAIADVQTLVRAPSLSYPRQAPTPPYSLRL